VSSSSVPGSEQGDEAVASTRSANPLRAHTRLCRAGLLVAALLGVGVAAAGCGGESSHPGVAKLGKATATTGSPAAQGRSKAGSSTGVLAFIGCMRTHGEPDMPEPSVSKSGREANININPSSGIDPNSPQFITASNACKHFLPNKGAPSAGQTITPADQADYLKGAACMRSHGVSNFPDPTFQDNTVTFKPQTPINTSSPEYARALATCQKLIPAGLPYSSSSGP
jgi:hypothetical protein